MADTMKSVLCALAFTVVFATLAFAQPKPAAAEAAAPASAQASGQGSGQQEANAPPAPKEVDTIGDWTLRCFDAKVPAPCDIMQAVVTKDKQQPVLSTFIAYVPSQKAYMAQIITPLGISLAKGLSLKAGDIDLQNIKFRHCENNGCYVEVNVAPDVIDALAKAEKGTISFTPYNSEKSASLPLSLTGFSDAVAKLKTEASDKAVAPKK